MSENLPQEVKKISALTATEQKALILEALLKAGFNQYQSAQLMKISRQHASVVNKKIKTGTLNPLVTRARKAVKSLLEGNPVGAMTEVKGSDVLTAAKMVLDRSDPITQKVESTHVNVNYDLRDEDRERYKKALGIVDAQFTVLPEPVAALPAPEEAKNEAGG